MEDDVTTFHASAHAVAVGDVTGEDLHVTGEGAVVQPSAFAEGIVMHH